ncbi:hypothetical protein BT63DRAFT_429099 [Microthyrium microscopicum]|uniref:Uncharacterized protein n=1 Tax=Microthyrium microscopicum TaxID=703497 RepID=A0A6A6TZA5_9PEZI|nr:hypothetical protein BT63DRAFT_429099 [Microthyrium microscopicum]
MFARDFHAAYMIGVLRTEPALRPTSKRVKHYLDLVWLERSFVTVMTVYSPTTLVFCACQGWATSESYHIL